MSYEKNRIFEAIEKQVGLTDQFESSVEDTLQGKKVTITKIDDPNIQMRLKPVGTLSRVAAIFKGESTGKDPYESEAIYHNGKTVRSDIADPYMAGNKVMNFIEDNEDVPILSH
ncbi:MAG: hypothetical protein ACRBDI_05940 [Alphaproteobacteria bacterium]